VTGLAVGCVSALWPWVVVGQPGLTHGSDLALFVGWTLVGVACGLVAPGWWGGTGMLAGTFVSWVVFAMLAMGGTSHVTEAMLFQFIAWVPEAIGFGLTWWLVSALSHRSARHQAGGAGPAH